MKTGRGWTRRTVILLAALWLGAVVAQELTLHVPTSPAPVTPGRPVNLRTVVHNHTGSRQDLVPDVLLPAGWRTMLPPSALSVPPGEQAAALITVIPPRSARAGNYDIGIRFAQGDSVYTATQQVHIQEVREVAAYLITAPRLVIGEPFEVLFGIDNRGNVPEPLLVELRENHGFELEVLTRVPPLLLPGETLQLPVLVTPAVALEKPVRHRVTLSVGAGADDPIRVVAFSDVEVAATGQPLSLAYRTFDLTLETKLNLDRSGDSLRSGTGPGVRVYGRGPISEAGDDELTVSLSAGRAVGGKDYVRYRRAEFALEVGDIDIAGNAIRPSSNGIGVSLGIPGARNAADAGSVYMLTGRDGAVAGATASTQVTPWLEAAGEVRLGGGSALFSARLDADLDLDEDTELRLRAGPALDLGRGLAGLELGAEVRTGAVDADVYGHYLPAGYDGAAFPTHGVGASLSIKEEASSPVSLSAAYRQVQRGDGDRYRGATVELASYTSEQNWSVRYLYFGRTDENGGSRRQDVTYRGRYELRDGFEVKPRVWWEKREDFGDGELEEEMGFGVDFALAAGPGILTPGLEVRYSLADATLDSFELALGWQGALTTTTGLDVSLETELVDDWSVGLAGSLSHELDARRTLALGTEIDVGAGGVQRLQADLGLHFPVRLNLGKRSDVGQVSGTVRDARGEGLAGKLVWLAGYTALTDEEGRFTFPAVPAGRHAITIKDLEPGQVVTPALPHSVEVAERSEQTVELRVGRASTISGKVRQAAAETGGEAPTAFGLHFVLEGPAPLLQEVLGNDATFRFSHLPSGLWRLRVVPESIPEGFTVEPQAVAIDLPEGSDFVQSFELKPVSRKLVLTGGGKLSN